MKITYKIEEVNGRFILTDSTDNYETFFRRANAEKAMSHWKLEHKHREMSYKGNTIQRAKIALAFLLSGDTDSRVYDNCFEMGDGHLVAAHLTILADKAGIKYPPESEL